MGATSSHELRRRSGGHGHRQRALARASGAGVGGFGSGGDAGAGRISVDGVSGAGISGAGITGAGRDDELGAVGRLGVPVMGVAWRVHAAAVAPSNDDGGHGRLPAPRRLRSAGVRIAAGGGVLLHRFVDEQHRERCRKRDDRCRGAHARAGECRTGAGRVAWRSAGSSARACASPAGLPRPALASALRYARWHGSPRARAARMRVRRQEHVGRRGRRVGFGVVRGWDRASLYS